MSQPELLLVAEFSGTAPLARLLALFHLALKRGSVEKGPVQYISVNISIHVSHRRASATWAVLSSGAIPRGLFRLPQGPVLSSGPVESNNIGIIDYIVIFFAIFQSGQSELIPKPASTSSSSDCLTSCLSVVLVAKVWQVARSYKSKVISIFAPSFAFQSLLRGIKATLACFSPD